MSLNNLIKEKFLQNIKVKSYAYGFFNQIFNMIFKKYIELVE